MRPAPVPSFKLVTWKIEDLKRSPLNARIDLETDPETVELAESLKSSGLLQEPAVRHDGTIIFGTRRVFAAKIARWKEITCKTYPKTLTAVQEHFLRIEENLRRKDLNALERARELQSFVDMMTGKGKQKTAAAMLGMSESGLCRHLAVLDLPPIWQDLIAAGTAEASHTRCIQDAAKIHEALPPALAKRYEELHQTRRLSVREWELEAAQFIQDQCRPVAADGSRAVLPMYAPYRADLDVRQVGGRPMAFNVALWSQITGKAEKKKKAIEVPELDDATSRLPLLSVRQRIALNWFNRRILAYFARHAPHAVKWIPLLDISLPISQQAIAEARALKEWSLDGGKSIPIVRKVPASGGTTFLVEYLRSAAKIALQGGKQFVKDFHQAKAFAEALGIDYAEEFPKLLTDEDKKDIADVYGGLPAAGRFPKGMDPRCMQIAKVKS